MYFKEGSNLDVPCKDCGATVSMPCAPPFGVLEHQTKTHFSREADALEHMLKTAPRMSRPVEMEG